MGETPKPRRSRRNLPNEREIKLRPRTHRPSKAELEQEHNMPGADIRTVRRDFFRHIKVRETSKDS